MKVENHIEVDKHRERAKQITTLSRRGMIQTTVTVVKLDVTTVR